MGAPVHPSLRRFIWDIQSMVELADSEREILVIGRDLMARLVDSVWEILGLLRGNMIRQHFLWEPGGAPRPSGAAKLFNPGAVEAVGACDGKAVQLSNAVADTISISIHVYGGDIGKITRYPLEAGGTALAFASVYANPEDSPAYDIHSIQTEIRD